MAVPRKRYRVTRNGIQVGVVFRSGPATYAFVREYAEGGERGTVTVWIDEGKGRGWERYEGLDLAEVAVVQGMATAQVWPSQ